ncbi:dTMP kinase [Stieleria bergensis]|uniref:dTMP kinase n=1 Tax=Stieleria bergensis TaxID=2528025 RepID=UPI003AF3A9E3
MQEHSVIIAVDGIDGVGKSSQIATIQHWLEARGHHCLCTRDPGSTAIGLRLRELLLDSDLTMHRRTEALLFMSSRCEMVESIIRPALANQQTVITDRFLLSNVVYQSIPPRSSEQATTDNTVSPELLWQLGRLANNGLQPALTILLDMPAAKAMTRISGPGDRMESRGVEYMEKVRQAFLKQLPNSGGATAVINADQPIEQVTLDVQRQLATHFADDATP